MRTESSNILPSTQAGGRTRAECLDGLRGFAVAFVVLSHLSSFRMPAIPGFDFSGSGFYGVCLFFTLSAFLLTSLLLERGTAPLRSLEVWKTYFKRRVLRIYPLYTSVLLGNAVLAALGAGFVAALSLGGVADHLLLRAGVDVFWTIPVECHFYLLLPLIVVAGAALPQRPVVLATAAVLLLVAVIVGNAVFPSDSRMALLRNLPAFIGGVYAAWASRWIDGFLGASDSGARTVLEIAGWLAIIGVLLHIPSVWAGLSGVDVPLDLFHDNPGRFGTLWTVCLLAAVNGRGALRSVLSTKPLRYLGTISFSVYLLHLPIVRLLGSHLAQTPTLAAWTSIVATIGVATISYVVIEKPFVALGRAPRTDGDMAGPDPVRA